MWPDVTILLITYDRPDEIRKTYAALKRNLKYDGQILWHIADDNTPGSYLDDIHCDTGLCFSRSITDRKGWGANVNKALHEIITDYVFQIEDDYVSRYEVNISSGIALLEQEKGVGLVRYDGVSGHSLNLFLRESRTGLAGRMDYMVISKESPHLNVYSHRPHLKHRRFHDSYGYYKEAQPGEQHLGMCETEFAHRIKDMTGPLLAILDDGVKSAFEHIGISRQNTEKDVVK